MTTLQTSTPNVRQFPKEALARLVEESYWPLGGAVERLEMLELDIHVEKAQADVKANLVLQKGLADQIAKLTGAERTKKTIELAAIQQRWDTLYKRWNDLLKRRFPA